MFYYQATDDGVTIFGGRDFGGIVEIPQMIDGRLVTGLSPYAFSSGHGRREMLKAAGSLFMADWEGKPLLGNSIDDFGNLGSDFGEPGSDFGSPGDTMTEIILPSGIRKIGNYAFYNCYDLKIFRCHSSIEDVGSGLFTGCTGIRRLEIRLKEGKRSCFKDLISELWQELFVSYYAGGERTMLVFPEMYEESVENTPARLISRKMHGCGHLYRYCFQESVFQFAKYDALFPHVGAENQEWTAVCLAMGRLKHPLQLQEKHRLLYEVYLKEHMALAAEIALKSKRVPEPEAMLQTEMELDAREGGLLAWLGEGYCDSKELLTVLIGAASRVGARELSFLLDLEHRRFPSGRRTFSI